MMRDSLHPGLHAHSRSLRSYWQGLGGFLPPQITGNVLWLRADLGITLNGSLVSAWADQSGTGDSNKNCTQATAGNQPTFTAASASYNNQPAVTFSRTGDNLASGAWATGLAQPCTFMAVGNTTNAGASDYFFGAASGNRLELFDSLGASVTLYAGAAAPAAGVGTLNTASVCFAVFNGASATISVRTNTPQATGNCAADSPLQNIMVGNLGASGTQSLSGPLCELAAWSRVLTAAEIATLAGYVTSRYGIAVGA
jgi:hypothetical protein